MTSHQNAQIIPLLLTPADVSTLLGVAEGTLRNWRSKGTGPLAIRVGGLVMYRRVDVEAYVDERHAAAVTNRNALLRKVA